VKLYFRERDFLCRHCHRLAYASQREGELARVQRLASNIRRRAGDQFCAREFPKKPKGMWWRTYKRRREQASEAKVLADAVFVIRTRRLLARSSNRSAPSKSRTISSDQE
jgi:hypothetical protein